MTLLQLVNGAVVIVTAVASGRAVRALARGSGKGNGTDGKAKALEVPQNLGAKPPRDFVNLCKKHNQEHLLNDWHELAEEERKELLACIASIDMQYLAKAFETSMSTSQGTREGVPEPVKDVKTRASITELEDIRWRNLGYALIAQGKLGVVTMAGGQGTRLGSNAPKGCYDIGLPSKKSLFQLQAERIRRLEQLAAVAYYNTPKVSNKLHVYIMTSPMTDEATRAHYRENSFFGLDEEQVHFFQQGTMPCVDSNGKIIMETCSKIATSPNGNGGLYSALADSGCIAHMKQNGIQCVDVNCIDNALARVADPLFNGFCWEQGAECGARTLAKANPMEKVGVFVKDGANGLGVREYSEMPSSELPEIDPDTGLLKYNWSNICMHHFTVAYMEETAAQMTADAVFHVAHKKIPSKDGNVQGIKLEQFIFDPFPNARRTALLEVNRSAEFAPVKNAPHENKPDSPETARAAVLKLHKSWVEDVGGSVKIQKGNSDGVEISPLVSFGGEGLEHLCHKHVFKAAYDVVLQGLAPLHVYKAAAKAAANSHNANSSRSSQGKSSMQRRPSFDIGNIFKRTVSHV